MQLDWPAGRAIATVLYVGLIAAYAARESWLWQRSRTVNVPRNLLLAGTLVSWYVGIVLFNGDLAFTLDNSDFSVCFSNSCSTATWLSPC